MLKDLIAADCKWTKAWKTAEEMNQANIAAVDRSLIRVLLQTEPRKEADFSVVEKQVTGKREGANGWLVCAELMHL